MAQAKKPIVFYAYPGKPSHIGETVGLLSKKVKANGDIDMRLWVDLEIAGLKIYKQVLRKIDQSDVFACDLTYINNNVLFELGYAIAKRKKIFISIDVTISEAHKNYVSLSPLTSLGYIGYQNSHELEGRLYESKVTEGRRKNLADDLNLFGDIEPFGLFYLKSAVNTNASIQVAEAIADFPFQNIVDDPSETPSDSLMWYARNIGGCTALIAHFMSIEQPNHQIHNNKVSLVAGMAFAYGKPTFLLAPEPFESPSDIPDFIRKYTTASHAKTIVRGWLSQLVTEENQLNRRREDYKSTKQKNRNLKTINLGQYMAENEYEDLFKYFVETGAYNEIINGRQTIFIGRKGTGKTANLYAAADHFRSDKRNLVVLIKPAGYEVSALIKILDQAKEVEIKGFFVELLWKYLLLTEIARNIDDKFKNNVGMSANRSEQDLIDFSVENSTFLSESFATRLRNILSQIDIETYLLEGGSNTMDYLGSKLHSKMILALKRKLAPVLQQYSTVAILIDNLDKGWDNRSDVERIAEILFGLLSTARHLPDDIRRDSIGGRNINLRMTVFLRSDIYSHVLKAARERDKLEVQHIRWNDKELLSQVLDQRLISEFPGKIPDELWSQFFVASIEGVHPREFILNNIRLRPRDAIFLIKSIIGIAISKGHTRVEEDDIYKAMEEYSRWVYNSIIDEDDPSKNHMRDILFKFAGDKTVYTEDEVRLIIQNVTGNDVVTQEYFNLLFDSHFFEIEYSNGSYRTVDDPDDRELLIEALRKKLSRKSEKMTFRINKPFHKSLYLED